MQALILIQACVFLLLRVCTDSLHSDVRPDLPALLCLNRMIKAGSFLGKVEPPGLFMAFGT